MGQFLHYGCFTSPRNRLSEIVEIKIGADGKFISGRINAAKQEDARPIARPTGAAIRVVRGLSKQIFKDRSPKISDDGVINRGDLSAVNCPLFHFPLLRG